jgi:hypothetical protein
MAGANSSYNRFELEPPARLLRPIIRDRLELLPCPYRGAGYAFGTAFMAKHPEISNLDAQRFEKMTARLFAGISQLSRKSKPSFPAI